MSGSMTLTVGQLPDNTLAYTNKLYVHRNDLKILDPSRKSNVDGVTYVQINGRDGMVCVVGTHADIKPGQICFSRIQRNACRVSQAAQVQVSKYMLPETANHNLINLRFDVGVFRGSLTIEESSVVDFVTTSLKDQIFCLNAQFVHDYEGNPIKMTVSKLQVASTDEKDSDIGRNVDLGIISNLTAIGLNAETPKVKINHMTSTSARGVVGPQWKYSDMGIGGLDVEFTNIFRRAFASRTIAPHIAEKLGVQHVRGLLLYGPPGTGKTLIARQIGKMLQGREPKVVNGPEILNKYVGQSEENIRNLFVDAEQDQDQNGINSDLHIIIFDEIDAICKQRGSQSGGTGVHDTVVNQLLSKMDGVDSLNNILVIGMTNRKDLIDDALLRPGRFEVHIEIGLPDLIGRVQILKIHTARMREESILGEDVDFEVLGEKTKNFSGAEIAGLIRSAQAFAFYGKLDVHDMENIGVDSLDDVKVGMDAFAHALEEIQPAFGVDKDDLQNFVGRGIIDIGPKFGHIQKTCNDLFNVVRNSEHTSLMSILLHGGIGTGKTALAAHLAIQSQFFFTKMISAQDLVGYSENQRCQRIVKIFDDAYKSPLSLIILDDIERLLGYVPIGPRFSNQVLQTLFVLIKKNPPIDVKTNTKRKLLLIGTTSNKMILEEMDLLDAFRVVLECPKVSKPDEFAAVFRASGANVSKEDLQRLCEAFTMPIGVKELLEVIEAASERGGGRVTFDGFQECVHDLDVYRKF